MSLSEIVTVNIQAGTVNPARAGFGIPLFMSHHTAWSGEEVRRYTSFSGVSADFPSTSMPYKWASIAFSQNPRLTELKIGRLPAPAAFHTQALDGSALTSAVGTITGRVVLPSGVEHAISIAWTTDIATTLGALKTFLDGLTGIGTCTVAAGVLTCPADVAGLVHFDIPALAIRDVSASFGYETALDAAALIDPDFFAVAIDSNSPKNMDKVARWALANERIAAFAPQYTKPSQFVSGEFSAPADYTALLENDSALGLFTKDSRLAFKEAGWLGRMLPGDPGSATWAFKQIQGVGTDTYTATERGQITAVNANYLSRLNGLSFTREGKTFGGEWIDVTIGLAWFEARLQERFLAALLNNEKIPYTDDGMAILESELRAQLAIAVGARVFDAGWTVTVPSVAEQDPLDRAARTVRGIEFQARLQGAVHKILINGTVTV